MKSQNKFFAYCLLFIWLLSTPAFAELYTWTDKEGVVHFGDEVPEEYQDKSRKIQLEETNQLPISENNKKSSTIYSKSTKKGAETNASEGPTAKIIHDDDAEQSCKQQHQEYQKSVDCFSRCAYRPRNISVANCPECEQISEPDCEISPLDEIEPEE